MAVGAKVDMVKLVRDERPQILACRYPMSLKDQTRPVDCQRIAQSFTRLDEAYGEVRLKTTEAVEKAEEAVAAKADAARARNEVSGIFQKRGRYRA